MASNSKAKDLYTKLQNDFPDKNILLIHKETSDEDKLSKLLKVNEIWVNYDIVIYTPNDLFDGTDSFTFWVYDGVTFSNVATVTINVNNCLTNLSEADPIENCDIEGSGFW